MGSTPSMRKGCDGGKTGGGEEKTGKKEKNTSLAAKGALANRLQRRTACKIQNGRQGAPKWQRGSGKVSTTRFLGVPVNFPSMRKGRDGEKIMRHTTGAQGYNFLTSFEKF